MFPSHESSERIFDKCSLEPTSVYILVGKTEATAMIDTGSSGSFISEDFVKKNKLKVQPATGRVHMASSSLNAPVKGQCTINSNLQGVDVVKLYQSTSCSACASEAEMRQ